MFMFSKFVVSSVTSFLVDAAIFAFLANLLEIKSDAVCAPVAIAVAISRIVSAHYNYFCNSYFVFRAGQSRVSYRRYFYLVIIIAVCSWGLTSMIVKVLTLEGFWVTAAKIMVDGILFLISYVVQRRFIFIGKGRSI